MRRLQPWWFLLVAVAVWPGLSVAGDAAIPGSLQDIEAQSREALATLKDVKVALGKPLAPAQLEGKSLVELRLMRNSIYAQYGVPFTNRWLRDYFETRGWYKKADKPAKVVAEADLANAHLILAREEALAPKKEPQAPGDRPIEYMPAMSEAELAKLPDYRVALDQPVDLARAKGLKRIELKLLRNSIFAQHGKVFDTPWLQAYFKTRPWYTPASGEPSALSAIDKRNVEALAKLEPKPSSASEVQALTILDASYCSKTVPGKFYNEERFVFFAEGSLGFETGNTQGPYPYDYDVQKRNGSWRVTNGVLEVRLDEGRANQGAPLSRYDAWEKLELDGTTHRCR